MNTASIEALGILLGALQDIVEAEAHENALQTERVLVGSRLATVFGQQVDVEGVTLFMEAE